MARMPIFGHRVFGHNFDGLRPALPGAGRVGRVKSYNHNSAIFGPIGLTFLWELKRLLSIDLSW